MTRIVVCKSIRACEVVNIESDERSCKGKKEMSTGAVRRWK